MQLLEDRICRGSPFERLEVGVVCRDEVIDALNQLLDTGERAAADGLVGDQREEALDLVEPRTVGRDEMHVPARSRRQPRLDLGVAVGGVVVGNAVDVQLGRHGLVDLAQEGQELLMTVARLARSQHRAVEHVQRREQRGRTVALVVVGNTLDIAEAHRQHRLGALQGLALALLVHADYQRVVRRAQVQADHVAQLLDEERVVGQLEAFGAVRLQAEELEVARNAALGDARLSSDRANAPVRRAIGRLGVQRGLDQMRHALVVDHARLARANVVVQTGDAPLDEPSAPLAHSGLRQLQALGDGVVGFAVGAAQNDAGPIAQCSGKRAAARKALKLRTLLVRQQHFDLRSARSHRGISGSKIPHWHARLMPVINGTAH